MAHKFVTGIQLCSSCEQAASYRAWTNRQWSKGIRANHSVKDRCTETLLITAAQAVTAVMDGVGALICPGDNLILFRWCGGRRDGRYSARTCTTRIGSKRQRIVAFLQPLHALFRRLLHQVFNPRGRHDRRYPQVSSPPRRMEQRNLASAEVPSAGVLSTNATSTSTVLILVP